jgi:hypothetical protein
MKGTKSSTANPPVSLQQRRQAVHKQKNAEQQEQLQVLNQQPAPLEHFIVKPVPNLRDRRNQRKMGHADEGSKTNDLFTSEIDRIKEETQMITSNQ